MSEDEFPIQELSDKHCYYKEKMVYFYYQLTRTGDLNILRSEFDDFIQVLKSDKSNTEYKHYIYQVYKLTLHTRDQYNGKGEHDISYMLVDVLYLHFPTIALACLYQFVHPCYRKQAFGSWRDIKYLCEYTKNEKLIDECVQMANTALSIDILKLNSLMPSISQHIGISSVGIRKQISNIAKWIPRENKRFHWLFNRLALDWSKRYHPYALTNENHENYEAALKKAKMRYRKLVASLNKLLDTTETKLCANQWNKLNIENIPQHAFTKYKSALCKYVFEDKEQIFDKSFYNPKNMQRLECSLKTKKYFENKYYPEGEYEPDRQPSTYKPFSLPISTMIKSAFDAIDNPNELNSDVLNCEWSKLSDILGNTIVKNAIPMIDMSFMSRQTDSYYTAIGLACLIAERSSFGRRILVIDNKLSWINIESETTLTEMIKKIRLDTKSQISTVADTESALKELTNYIDEAKLPNAKIKELSLIYFLTQASIENLHDKIIQTFYQGGLVGSRNLAFPCPKIVYWNLSQKKGHLPAAINSKNSFFLSGHSANLINNIQSLKANKYDTVLEIIKDYIHPANMD